MTIPEELAKRRLMAPRCQSDVQDPIIFAILYWPIGSPRWYIAEYEPRTGVAFGYVSGNGGEGAWGYFSIPEQLADRIAGICPLRLQASFEPTAASALRLPQQKRP